MLLNKSCVKELSAVSRNRKYDEEVLDFNRNLESKQSYLFEAACPFSPDHAFLCPYFPFLQGAGEMKVERLLPFWFTLGRRVLPIGKTNDYGKIRPLVNTFTNW